MTLTLHLDKTIFRFAVILLALVLCVGVFRLIYKRFVIEALTRKNAPSQLEAVAAAVTEFPQSSRLQARVAETLLNQPLSYSEILSPAETAAELAATQSPYNARYRLLLATVKGVKGDQQAEEKHLRAALALAPQNTQMHWRLGNLLLRTGKFTEAADEFRVAATANSSLLGTALDLLWQLSEGNVELLTRATGDLAANRIQLAQFLLQQSRADEAIRLVNAIDRNDRAATPKTGEFLNGLITAGKINAAHQLWMDTRLSPEEKASLLWNGSFENASPAHLSQFEWQLRSSEFAQLTVDQYVAHTGTKSLRLDFTGRDTTRITNEIKQTIVVEPGKRYRLTCFVRTAKLLTPEGPRIVIATQDAARVIAQTSPINAESSDWQPFTLDFTAPSQTPTLIVTVQRTPRGNHDDPTQGIIWFDDFALTALTS